MCIFYIFEAVIYLFIFILRLIYLDFDVPKSIMWKAGAVLCMVVSISPPILWGLFQVPQLQHYVNHGLKHSFEPITRLKIYMRPSNLFLVLESIFMDLVFIL